MTRNFRFGVRATSLILAALVVAGLFYQAKQAGRGSEGEFFVFLNDMSNQLGSNFVSGFQKGVDFEEMRLIVANMGDSPLTNVWLSLKISNSVTNRVVSDQWVPMKTDGLFTEFGLRDELPIPKASVYPMFYMDATNLTAFGMHLYAGAGSVTHTSRLDFVWTTGAVGERASIRQILASERYHRDLLMTEEDVEDFAKPKLQ